VRAPTLGDIELARTRIRRAAIRTPLVRWFDGPADIRLKLEVLQPIGSFKIRGALNAIAALPSAALADGVVTASAGNMAQGVAWCARDIGVPCTVVVPDHAPDAKTRAVQALGARVVRVPFDRWWRVLEERRFDGAPGAFIHPVADPAVIAGNATIGLEIVEDWPEVEVVLAPFGGGGLSCGIGAALRAVRSTASVRAVEPETASPLAVSLAAGRPRSVQYRPSFVDGAGGRSVLPEMWPLVRALIGGSEVVSLAEVEDAIRALVARARVVAEGAGALSVAAALSGGVGAVRVGCVVSGGYIDPDRLAAILAPAR
jgi:threonine dehydratase